MKKAAVALCAAVVLAAGLWALNELSAQTVLRIYDYETKEIYVEVPAKEGDQLFFGWIHSWEKIPWHEYYHIDANHDLILDMIAFPAFGAGIPENKGTEVWVDDDGMIYMNNIGQVFHEFTWINSHFATRDIVLNDVLIAKGETLPEHTRVNLIVTKRRFLDGKGNGRHAASN
jgi:hypothetical protein